MTGNVPVQKASFKDNFHTEVVQVFDNLSISANTLKSTSVKNIIPVLEGFTPIGITGFYISNGSTSGSNSEYCSVVRLWQSIDDDYSVYYGIRNNNTSAAAKIRLRIKVLYAADN